MKKIITTAIVAFLVACVGDSTVGPNDGGGIDAKDSGCTSPSAVCTLGSQTTCTDLSTDSQNCGSCNTVCPTGTTCAASQCACSDATKTYCGSACVDLQKDPNHCGACSNQCANAHCTAGVCDRTVFLSSNLYFADFGETPDGGATDPLAAADAACNALAKQAQLTGTYMAWLGTANGSPATRFKKSTAPYVLVDGTTVVANDWTDLTKGTIQHSIDLTEQKLKDGNTATRRTLTNVAPDGTTASPSLDCSAWTSKSSAVAPTIGDSTVATADWTKMASPDPLWTCALQYHIYCFEQ